jgi:hypothetical protein
MRMEVGLRTALAAVGVVALAAGVASTARAETARVRLEYARGEGATSCPDARAFAAAVAGRLGYEPFDPAAARRVNVTIGRRERGFDARIQMLDAGGAPTAERQFSSRAGDCAELAATTELALAIAIDPFRAAAPAPPIPPAAPAADVAPPPARPPTAAPAESPPPSLVVVAAARPEETPPPRPTVVEVAAAVVGGVGAAPVAALGFEVRVGARRGDLSLAIEGRADLPASTPLQTGDVSAWLLAGSLVPCVHWRAVAACALASAGVLRAAGDRLVDARQVTDPWLALGARVATEVPLRARVAFDAHLDAVAPLVETELKVGGAAVWTTPAIALAAALGLAVAFP